MASTIIRKAVLEPVKVVSLRVGPRPRWEEEEKQEEEEEEEERSSDEEHSESGEKELRSLADSHLILQSLRQSRHILLTTFFIRFSSKSKAKNAPEVPQAPHTLDFLGKCILQFGPHLFYGTRFYQVNYTPEPGQQQWPYAQQTWADAQAYVQAQAHVTPVSSYSPQPSTSQPMSLPSDTPGTGIQLTQALIAEVDAATAADPELAQIRALAAENKASTAQLHKLGTLIQAINSRSTPRQSPSTGTQKDVSTSPVAQASASPIPQASAPSAPSTPAASVPYQAYHATYTKPPRKPDIVFELRENPTERWLLPCDNAMIERRKAEDGTVEVLLSTFLHGEDPTQQPPPKTEADGETTSDSDQKLLPVTIHFLDVPEILWHALMYCSDFNNPASRAHKIDVFEDMLKSSPPRVYLQHRLPVGTLPADLDEAVSDKFAPKPYNASSHRPPPTPNPARTGSARGTVIGPDGVPVKKERKYAVNRWKDGTPRWCQGCGTTETGAWRRGPNGPGTLCGSCGSKFKTRPEQFKLPDKTFTPEEVLEMEEKRKEIRERKAADAEAAAAAAAEKAERAAAAAGSATPDMSEEQIPAAKRRRRPTPKGELEPWPAFAQPSVGAGNASARPFSGFAPPAGAAAVPPSSTPEVFSDSRRTASSSYVTHTPTPTTYNGHTYASYEEAYAAWYEYARAYDARYYSAPASSSSAAPSAGARSYSAEYEAWYRQYYSAYAAHYGEHGYRDPRYGSYQHGEGGSYSAHPHHYQRPNGYDDYGQQPAAPYQPYYSTGRAQEGTSTSGERQEVSGSAGGEAGEKPPPTAGVPATPEVEGNTEIYGVPPPPPPHATSEREAATPPTEESAVEGGGTAPSEEVVGDDPMDGTTREREQGEAPQDTS